MENLETRYYRNNIICKKICMIAMGKDFTVFEDEAVYDLGPITSVQWNRTFLVNCPNRDYAKTCYLGRVSAAALQEGNVEDLIREQRETRIYKDNTQHYR